MKNKSTLIIVIVFIAVIIVGTYFYIKGKASSDEGTETVSLFPSISEIMAKGYDQKEAEQILDGLTAGRITSY